MFETDSRRQKILGQLIAIEKRLQCLYPKLQVLALLYKHSLLTNRFNSQKFFLEAQKLKVEAPDRLIRASYWLCDIKYTLILGGRPKDKQLQKKFLKLKSILNELDRLHQLALILSGLVPRYNDVDLERMSALKSEADLLHDVRYFVFQNSHEKEAVGPGHLLQLLAWLLWITSYLFEGACCGDLLDAWWLEFWEIILLAAGDVERNPGPRQITDEKLAKVDNQVLGKQDLFKVRDAINDCRKCWFDLCLALQLSCGDLSAIKKEHGGNTAACLREGLCLWLQGGRATWRMLVDAVANTSGGNDLALALEIAKKHEVSGIQAVEASSVSRSTHRDHVETRKFKEEMCSAFNKLYRSICDCHLRVKASRVKNVLEFCTNPENLSQRCVPPSVYEDATSTKDLLRQLYPNYINPEKIFVLQEIVNTCGSQRCKNLVNDYARKFIQ